MKLQRIIENAAIVLCLLALFVPLAFIIVDSFNTGHYR